MKWPDMMKTLFVIALLESSACSTYTDPPGSHESSEGSVRLPDSSEAKGGDSTPKTASIESISDVGTGTADAEDSTSDDGDIGELDTSAGDSDHTSGDSGVTEGDFESELTSDVGGWEACAGEIPRACLGISSDIESCPGTAGGCTWHSCVSDRTARSHIDYLECLASECGIELVLDTECMHGWADLSLDCFRTMCDPNDPQACSFINRGAQHECQK